jgi:hypothetical protein
VSTDWTQPSLASQYSTFLQYLKDRDLDTGKLFFNTAGIGVDNIIEFNRAGNKFREWSAANVPTDLVLSVAGGGTGSTTPGGIRSVLGLGTMATQNSNAVAITGGTLAGDGAGVTNLNAANLATGTVPLPRLGVGAQPAGAFLRSDNTWQIIPPSLLVTGGFMTVPFNANYESTYICGTGCDYVILPTLIGADGKRVVIVNFATTPIVVYPQGGQNILNNTAFVFDYGAYSSITCLATTANQWVIV